MTFGQPAIPAALLHGMEELRAPTPTYDPEHGGQYIPGTPQRIPFQGTVLPLSDDDIRRMPSGTYTKRSRKVYTNGYILLEGTQVYDPPSGDTYTVGSSLDHGLIHGMRRYVVEMKGASAAK